jgi:peptide/nickel transport system permease protein
VVVTGVIALSTLGRTNAVLIVVIGILFTPLIARTVRAAVLLERELDYVAAARLRGEGSPYIMFVEILPNVTAPILVEFTVRLAYAIFAVLTLTFLGLGIQPPTPDWAADILANFGVVPAGYWWEVSFASVAIITLAVSVTLISDSIQKAFEG